MLRQVAEGVLIHESEFCQSNAVVVHGRAGVLLIHPGCTATKWPASRTTCPMRARPLWQASRRILIGITCSARQARRGAPLRHGPLRGQCPGSAVGRAWKARIAELIPPDIAGQVPLDLLGPITGLPAEMAQIPWDGPQVRIVEHSRMPRAMRRC